MELQFFGAAREVTGSCYLIDSDEVRFLVDCGMFQGGREVAARNLEPFGFDPRSIDFVLLTHAHIDHSGLLPKLTRSGFTGPIYTTRATADLLNVMLPDSAHIQEEDAKRAERHGRKNAQPPIYDAIDAQDCLKQLVAVSYDVKISPHSAVDCRFRDAGHILGSAIIEVWVSEGERKVSFVFSGDLGQPGRPILRDPTLIEHADVLVVESTYGGRNHKQLSPTLDEFVAAINATDRGNVIIPAFAVGRTQEVLYYLHHLTRQGRLHNLNIFVDSPMATAATEITRDHLALFDEEAAKLASWRTEGHNLPALHFVGSVAESKALNQIRSGAIVISASGMCDAGRIRHHLRQNLHRSECTIIITGYQAQGSLGRRLVDGAERVRLFGSEIQVRAKIVTMGGFSAHADEAALMQWLGNFVTPPTVTYVVHGEEDAALSVAQAIENRLEWRVEVPVYGQREVV
ncbi:MAG: MBL fold metallo-hydrolase [Pseudomonadales bacterium]